jgi:hypothetical protein
MTSAHALDLGLFLAGDVKGCESGNLGAEIDLAHYQ